jgi:hypothetical protein
MLSGTKIAGDGANTYFMFRCAALYLDLGDYAKAAAEYRAAAKIYNFGGTGKEPQTVQLPDPDLIGAPPTYLAQRLRAFCETGMGIEVRSYGGVYGDDNEVAHFSRAAALAPDVAEVHYFYGIARRIHGLTPTMANGELRKAWHRGRHCHLPSLRTRHLLRPRRNRTTRIKQNPPSLPNRVCLLVEERGRITRQRLCPNYILG